MDNFLSTAYNLQKYRFRVSWREIIGDIPSNLIHPSIFFRFCGIGNHKSHFQFPIPMTSHHPTSSYRSTHPMHIAQPHLAPQWNSLDLARILYFHTVVLSKTAFPSVHFSSFTNCSILSGEEVYNLCNSYTCTDCIIKSSKFTHLIYLS